MPSNSAMMIPKSIPISLGILLSFLFVGCNAPLAVKQIQAKNPLAKNSAKTPIEIVDVWSSRAHTTSDGKVLRGMAGRIHFYDNPKKKQAVKVDGDLTVYVFDGNETDPAHAKPLKIFRFKAETLQQYYSRKKPLGHGYDFFLPMDEVGGEEQSLSIIVRFDNTLEEMFVTTQRPVNAVLAGRKSQPPPDPTIRDYLDSHSLHADTNRKMMATYDSAEVRQVTHVVEKDAEPEKSKVSTIPLTGNITRRLIESGKESAVENPVISHVE